ncbi:3-methyladenine DNA glycosylase [Rudaeicoccus suwonensis]|uniref:3-methyladenine DNA glycosylase n=1 Tax=Rudaeicoccus suwonensis TaxID=657409 RepID=UPI001BA96C45|nr:3-methyladenine DNA glycosylase [Rudaeicoccus suwonensis]
MDEQARHRARLAPYVEPHLERRRRGIKHPIHDFLFTYYSYRPAQLMRWQPPGELASGKRTLAESTFQLLTATAGREGNFGCFGLHEWAMVYRDTDTRHPQPLRLGSERTDEVVESHRIGCSHWDAVRFFTPAALPLNTLRPFKDDRADFEQPGCLHATMDLYKHAYRLAEVVGSDLIADAFELAWDVRVMDMRAAPYDMTGITIDPDGIAWTPITIETAAGKREYADLQRQFAQRAAPIRQRFIDRLEVVLGAGHDRAAPAVSVNG